MQQARLNYVEIQKSAGNYTNTSLLNMYNSLPIFTLQVRQTF